MHDQRRRHRRISFCAPVTVRAHGVRPSLARARNVSEGGMYISVPGAVSVGAEVSCEVSIDGVRHQIRARVAWVHRDGPDRPAAIGLAFCALDDQQTAALRSLVTTAKAQDRSRVWLDGISESIVGRTEHFEGGAVLKAALPFLELGRNVRLEVGDAERSGKIANIALATEPDTKVPYLRVEFALDQGADVSFDEERTDVTQFEPHVLHASEAPMALVDSDDSDVSHGSDGSDDLEVDIVVEADAAAPERDLPVDMRDARDMSGMTGMHDARDMSGVTDMRDARNLHTWRRAMIATGALVGVSCIALAARLANPRATSSGLATQAQARSRASAPVLPAPPAPAPATTPSQPAALVAPTEQTVDTDVAAAPSQPTAAPSAATEMPSATHETPSATPTASVDGPQIHVGDTTEIEIPLRGSTDGSDHYPLDEPPGLAINLPSAKVAFPFGDTHVGKGGVRFVRVSRRNDGIQIRLHFKGDTARPYDVTVDADRVRISVRR